MSKLLIFDYETFSEAPIGDVGAYEYARHPSTEILCVGFRWAERSELAKAPTRLWAPSLPESNGAFSDFLRALRDPDTRLVAHNAFFEQVITRFVFAEKVMPSIPYLKEIPLERWTCTAAMSRCMGLPGKLAQVGEALDLEYQKDDAGHRVMLKLSKPRTPTKNDPSVRHTPSSKPDDFEKLFNYCKADIDAEVELFLTLPEMHALERKFWIQDQKQNHRGFAVDRKLVKSAQNILKSELRLLDRRVQKISNGALNSTRQVKAVLEFLEAEGALLDNLQSATVAQALEEGEGLTKAARVVLEVRDAASKSSTSKYEAFEARTRSDGRARDNTIFYGAHTGRQSGQGLQPQNLAKSVFKNHADVLTGIKLIRRRDYHTIKALYDKPLDLLSSCLRSAIIAAPDSILDVGDFATIEVRVLFWLAGEDKGLQWLKDGLDLYIETAANIYGQNPAELRLAYQGGDKDAFLKRQLGKQTVLGSGFGIGVSGDKFQQTCAKYGIEISIDTARRAVRAYRETFKEIPKFWTKLEHAAKMAIKNPGKVYVCGRLQWKARGKFLECQLPSGRSLRYFKAHLENTKSLYGEKETITFWGVDSQTKKFIKTRTWGGKLAENVTQAVAADVMQESLCRLEETPSKPVLAVHDEAVCERVDFEGSTDEFLKTMAIVPEWAGGLPIKVEGWSEWRYRK